MTTPTAGSSSVGWKVECPVSARVADRLVTSRHSAASASAMLLRTSSSVATGPHSVSADSGSQVSSSPMCAPLSCTIRASVHRVMNSRASLSTLDLPLPVAPITPTARPPISLNSVRSSGEPSSGLNPQVIRSRMLAVSAEPVRERGRLGVGPRGGHRVVGGVPDGQVHGADADDQLAGELGGGEVDPAIRQARGCARVSRRSRRCWPRCGWPGRFPGWW